jgi:hypothetical protein
LIGTAANDNFPLFADWHPPHSERNLVKLVGEVSKKNKLLVIPPEIDSCSLHKYAKENVKNQVLGMKREPISIPFLNNSPQEDSVAVFKLILRYVVLLNLKLTGKHVQN